MNAMLYQSNRRRHGAALVYVVITVVAMMALCSLAVDLGRYELAHAQGYNAAVAAARAGAKALAKSGATSTSVTTAATNAAIANSLDGQTVTSSMVTVTFMNWNSSTNTGTVVSTGNFTTSGSTPVNAVSVYITYNVPLVFAQVLGLSSKTAVEHSTAELITQVDNPIVYATGNPWLAGEPAGTTASQPDPNWSSSSPNSDHLYQYDIAGTPGTNTHGTSSTTSTYSSYEANSSPQQVAFTVTPGATITITNASSQVSWDHDTSPWTDPTGNTGTTGNYDDAAAEGTGSEHGMSNCTSPLGSMLGVFLGSGLPDSISTTPAALDFSSQSARDYIGLEPKLQQVFYTGSGTTSTSKQQEIEVPAKATRLFLGIQDGWEWSNNNGSFNCTVTETYVITVQ